MTKANGENTSYFNTFDQNPQKKVQQIDDLS